MAFLGVCKDVWWLIFHRLDDVDLEMFNSVYQMLDEYWGYRMREVAAKFGKPMDNKAQYHRLLEDMVLHRGFSTDEIYKGWKYNSNGHKFYITRDNEEPFLVVEKDNLTSRCTDCGNYYCTNGFCTRHMRFSNRNSSYDDSNDSASADDSSSVDPFLYCRCGDPDCKFGLEES